jgi:TrmH family RNA methyltransferase
VILDGCRLAADLVRWDVPIAELYLTPEAAADPESARLIAAAQRVFELETDVLESVAPTRAPQGVLAVVAEPAWPPWSGRRGLALWLDTVQDPGNLGAIVRAAAGLGAAAVMLGPGCADPFAPLAVRGSAGAVLRLPVEREVTVQRAVKRVREGRGEVWATDIEGEVLATVARREPLLVMLGAEGVGLAAEALALAVRTVGIPLVRGIESLNVAVAAGILLWELRRSRGD